MVSKNELKQNVHNIEKVIKNSVKPFIDSTTPHYFTWVTLMERAAGK